MNSKIKDLPISRDLYLEALFEYEQTQGAARVKDVAEALEVNSTSVVGMFRVLRDEGLVSYRPHTPVRLTDKGRRHAESLRRRHSAMRRFLNEVLGIDLAQADEVACSIEHVVTPEIAKRFLEYAEYVSLCPRGGPRYIEGVGYRCVVVEDRAGCDECVMVKG